MGDFEMANIETWGIAGSVSVRVAAPDIERRIRIIVSGARSEGALRLTPEEALVLRDRLADALTKLSIERDAQQVSA